MFSVPGCGHRDISFLQENKLRDNPGGRVSATRVQNFPRPPSIPFSSLLGCQKGTSFFWEGMNVAARFCHVHPQGLTMPPPPPGPLPAAHSLRAGALPCLPPQTFLPSMQACTAARCFLLQYVTGFSANPPTLLNTCACPGA